MGIKALVAAAAVVVGVGQAEATTVSEYTFSLRYEGTSFYSVWVDVLDRSSSQYFGVLSPEENSFGFESSLFGTTMIGSVIEFAVQIVHPDVPKPELWYGNGGRTPVCSFGPWDCTSTNDTTLTTSGFRIAKDDDWWMNVSSEIGFSFSVGHWPKGIGARFTEDGKYIYSYRDEASHFTVLDVTREIAPVPLPAAAALLPMGIGAFAVLRKRRRSLG